MAWITCFPAWPHLRRGARVKLYLGLRSKRGPRSQSKGPECDKMAKMVLGNLHFLTCLCSLGHLLSHCEILEAGLIRPMA